MLRNVSLPVLGMATFGAAFLVIELVRGNSLISAFTLGLVGLASGFMAGRLGNRKFGLPKNATYEEFSLALERAASKS